MFKKFTLSLILILLSASSLLAMDHTLALKPGFNFVSFKTAVSLSPSQFKALDSSIEDIYLFSAAAGSFLSANEGTLSSLAAGKGYIVKNSASSNISVTVSGGELSSIGNIALKAGFNLVGFSKVPAESVSFTQLMNSYADITGIYKWSPAAGSFIQVLRNESGQPVPLDGADPKFAAGESYFINMKAASAINYDGASIVVGDNPVVIPVPSILTLSVSSDSVQINSAYDLSSIKAVASYSDNSTKEVAITWTLTAGSGSLAQTLYTAPSAAGSSLLTASFTDGGKTVTAGLNLTIVDVQAAAPVFAPAAGTYSSAQSVTITSATDGASIYYTTDGSEPTTASTLYGAPIAVTSSVTIKAVAIKTGISNSSVASAEYVINIPQVPQPSIADIYTDTVIPEIEIAGGGVQATPAPTGSVYYFGSTTQAQAKLESDIKMDDSIKYEQTAKRYIRVSGTAEPISGGYTDRFYHSVLFSVVDGSNVKIGSFSIPVNDQNKFDGYIYFTQTGKFTIYTYRSRNDTLYPRAPSYMVSENQSTLAFYVTCSEAVPSNLVYLLPSRDVNCGNKYVRDYAKYLTKDLTTDTDKAKKIFEFLVKGDLNGAFTYNLYNEIYKDYLDTPWNSIFMPSHFLVKRRGVCNDFSELFAAMCRTLGMEVKRKSGDDSTGAGHQWNLLYLDGSWKRLDAT